MLAAAPLPAPLERRQPAIEEALRASLELPSDPGLPLYGMVRYQLGWVDQTGEEQPHEADRVLGALCLEAAVSEGGGVAGCAPAAAAIELLGQSVQVHDDMQTATQQRNGRDAVWWVWGPAQAINAGDALQALAQLTLFRMQDGALEAAAELDSAALAHYEGQYLDLQLQERVDVSVAQYMRMARGKHGALVGGALALGASAAGADTEAVRAWREAGVSMGTAALIAEEARMLWSGGDAGRALNKSKLYPVVAALESGAAKQKRELAGYYFKRVMEPDDLEGVKSILDDLGARAKTEEAVSEVKREAMDALARVLVRADDAERWAVITDGLAAV